MCRPRGSRTESAAAVAGGERRAPGCPHQGGSTGRREPPCSVAGAMLDVGGAMLDVGGAMLDVGGAMLDIVGAMLHVAGAMLDVAGDRAPTCRRLQLRAGSVARV
jgi:hypothetical protein